MKTEISRALYLIENVHAQIALGYEADRLILHEAEEILKRLLNA